MNHPLVSVIIPCFNDHLFLMEAINSIKNQTYNNTEIIIVDDGSGLETKDFLTKISRDNLCILTQENSGPSAARNNGITRAKGEYILPLDADDYFEPNFIEEAVEILSNKPEMGLVTCHAKIFNGDNILGEIKSLGGNAVDFLSSNRALANSMFRKSCWEEVGGYDLKMKNGYEDWEFNISITKAGWKVYVIENHLFNYRKKTTSRNQDADRLYKYELIRYIYKKHQDVFKNNYEALINNTFSKMEKLEREKLKIKQTSTYKLGNFILSPIKFLQLLKSKFHK